MRISLTEGQKRGKKFGCPAVGQNRRVRHVLLVELFLDFTAADNDKAQAASPHFNKTTTDITERRIAIIKLWMLKSRLGKLE